MYSSISNSSRTSQSGQSRKFTVSSQILQLRLRRGKPGVGRLVGNFANVEYPNNFNSTILGGFRKFWANAVPGMNISAIFRNSHELLNPYITFLKD